MEPLIALSLASNVIQIIDFSAKIVSEGQKIYRSAEGTIAENEEAEIVAKDLNQLNENLRRSLKDSEHTQTLSDDDQSLVVLCEKCEAIARELLDKLDKVKVSGKHRKWKSAFQALKNVSSNDDLEHLASRLETYRSEITLHTVVSLRKRIDMMSLQQSTRFDDLEKNVMATILDKRADIMGALPAPAPPDSAGSFSEAGQDLHDAARTGNRARLRIILSQKGVDVNATTKTGQTALHLASLGGHSGVIQTLINSHVRMEAEDSRGQTALHCAAGSGHPAALHVLLMSGANKNAVDDDQMTPMYHAGLHKNDGHEVCAWILRFGYDLLVRDDRGDNLLVVAAYKGFGSLIQDLLARAPNTEVKGGAGITPLIAAAAHGKHKAVRSLLERGARTEATDPNGCTALVRAAWRGHTKAVEALLEGGANIEAKDSKGWKSLQRACRYGHTRTAQVLLQRGAKVHPIYLETTSERGRPDILPLLMQAGADIEYKSSNGTTALMRSAYRDDPEVARVLINHGANLEARRNDGATALWIAAEQGHRDVVRILINHGTNIESKGASPQYPPLVKAAQGGHADTVAILLDAGAGIESSNSNGVTALMEAAWINRASRISIATVPLDRGADLESRDVDQGGMTPLIRAACNNHHSVLPLFIERGADIEAKSSTDQRSALAEACWRGHWFPAVTLLNYGADVESRDRLGRTPLMHAVVNETITDNLLRYGAYREATDNEGLTAKIIAKRGNHEGVLKLLE